MRVPYAITQGKLSTRPGESNPPLSQPRHSFRLIWGIPDSVIQETLAFGIWIPGNFPCWNPEYSSKRAESHSTIGKQYPSFSDKESGIQNPPLPYRQSRFTNVLTAIQMVPLFKAAAGKCFFLLDPSRVFHEFRLNDGFKFCQSDHWLI